MEQDDFLKEFQSKPMSNMKKFVFKNANVTSSKTCSKVDSESNKKTIK